MYNYKQLPSGLQDGMKLYVEEGMGAGHFLTACLENDLSKAVSRADDKNINLLRDIVMWLYWEVPSACWGSQDKVANWHGLKAKRKEVGVNGQTIALCHPIGFDNILKSDYTE